MIAFVVAQIDPAVDAGRAVNALRTPALEVKLLASGRSEFVAAVSYEDLGVLREASERMRRCPGVRSTYLSLPTD
jgi:hypothetical protein